MYGRIRKRTGVLGSGHGLPLPWFFVLITSFLCASLVIAQSNINEDTIHFVGQASAFTVGSDLIINGDFASGETGWTFGTNWSIVGGKATHQAGNTATLVSTGTAPTSGRMHRIQFTISSRVAGNVSVSMGGVSVPTLTANQPYVYYFNCTTAAKITFTPDTNFDGRIDDVAVFVWPGAEDVGGGSTIAGYTGVNLDYMTATGQVLHNDSSLVLSNDGGSLAIAAATTWDTTPKVGALVKCDFSATFADGVYEITSASASSITIDLSSGGLAGEDVEVWIGGAFYGIAQAVGDDSTLSEDPDGTYRKRYIMANVPLMELTVTAMAAETDASNRTDDGSRKVIGYNASFSVVTAHSSFNVLSDMDEGQTYYGGANAAFHEDEGFSEVNPNRKWIEWDGNANTMNIVQLNASNFEMRNIKIHNVPAEGTNSLIDINAAIFNTNFVNCWFGLSFRWTLNNNTSSFNSVTDCYYDDALPTLNGAFMIRTDYSNCICNRTGTSVGLIGFIGCLDKCLIYKGATGIASAGSNSVSLKNCTLFGQTAICASVSGTQSFGALINNIFSPDAVSDNAISLASNSLSPLSFNNIMYSVTGGAALTNPIVNDQISPEPPLPRGTIEKDPLFVNVADGDFRLRVNSPALNAGLTSLFGGRTTIGAWGPNAIAEQESRARHAGTPIYR